MRTYELLLLAAVMLIFGVLFYGAYQTTYHSAASTAQTHLVSY